MDKIKSVQLLEIVRQLHAVYVLSADCLPLEARAACDQGFALLIELLVKELS